MQGNRIPALLATIGLALACSLALAQDDAAPTSSGGGRAAQAGGNGTGGAARAGGGQGAGQGGGQAAAAVPPPPITAPFRVHIIADNLSGGYALLTVDLNKDHKTDLVAIGLSSDTLMWYENPYWIPHVITTQAPKMVAMDYGDLDGDGIPEIAVAYEFNATPAKSVGSVSIFKHDGDPTKPWVLMKTMDQHLPSTHRINFANVDGKGHGTLVAAPILNAASPGFPDPDHTSTPLWAYRMENGWKPELISDQNKGVVHGLLPYDFFGTGKQDVLTAGYSGINAHTLEKDGTWKRTFLAAGSPVAWPGGGAGNIVAGKFAGKTFFATIEPFHGNMTVVYMQDAQGAYQRQVLDDGLTNGHAMTVVDVDSDGMQEVVAGGSRTKANLFFYRATDKTGQTWTKQLMDNNMQANACMSADIKGTGHKTDVVCIGGIYLKWYEYVGK